MPARCQRLAVYASIRNIGDSPDDIEIYDPRTHAVPSIRQRIESGSRWSFAVKGTY